MKIEDQVRESLEAAAKNGFDFAGWTDEAIAEDLVQFDPELEDQDPVDLVPAVRAWRAKKEGK